MAWTLEPGLFRDDYYDESSMNFDFQLLNSHHTVASKSAIDWLCLMQHYGMPTRLIDWSENLLVGLYFASQPDDGTDGALFALDPFKLNRQTSLTKSELIFGPNNIEIAFRATQSLYDSNTAYTDKLIDVSSDVSLDESVKEATSFASSAEKYAEKLRKPVAFIPNRNNERMVAQASVFTIHGGKRYKKNSKDKDKILPPISLSQARLNVVKKYIVDGKYKKSIRQQLDRIGISKGKLFPELEHQADTIKNRWKIAGG